MVSKSFWYGDRVRLTMDIQLYDCRLSEGSLGRVIGLNGAQLTDDASYRIRFDDGTRADILSTFIEKV